MSGDPDFLPSLLELLHHPLLLVNMRHLQIMRVCSTTRQKASRTIRVEIQRNELGKFSVDWGAALPSLGVWPPTGCDRDGNQHTGRVTRSSLRVCVTEWKGVVTPAASQGEGEGAPPPCSEDVQEYTTFTTRVPVGDLMMGQQQGPAGAAANRRTATEADLSVAFPVVDLAPGGGSQRSQHSATAATGRQTEEQQGQPQQYPVCAYLPVSGDQLALPFVLNADFVLTTSREHVKQVGPLWVAEWALGCWDLCVLLLGAGALVE